MKPFKLLKDARGRESITLTFVAVSFAILQIKFLLAGITISPELTIPPMSAEAFGLSTAGILAVWLGREWVDKGKNTEPKP